MKRTKKEKLQSGVHYTNLNCSGSKSSRDFGLGGGASNGQSKLFEGIKCMFPFSTCHDPFSATVYSNIVFSAY
jgi:hypothetical protein